jgi:sulfur-carrier protein adenylyltransferase/sulfurtransferase
MFSLSQKTIDAGELRDALQDPANGGFCSFEGWVRNHNDGRAVGGLEYEAYVDLALSEGQRIIEEALARFGALSARCVHRTGHLGVGDMAVWIGVGAAHRGEAFRACQYIIDEIKHRLPIWKKEHYLDGDTAWVACSHPAGDGGTPLTHAAPDARGDCSAHSGAFGARFEPDYSRQVRLPDVGELGQAKLAAARVLVLGAGGLGAPVLSYLAGAGVGTLGVVDGDVLEASNLHRQTIYRAGDIGHRKVDLVRREVAALNPSVKVRTYGDPLEPDNVLEVFADYDLVLDCTDSMASRYLSSDAAVLSATPLILASVYQYEGQLQWISGRPGDPCLRCIWPDVPGAATVGSCVESGVLGPVPGVLGAMQAMMALNVLLGLPGGPVPGVTLVDLLTMRMQHLSLDGQAGCDRSGGCAAVARQAQANLRQSENVDVTFTSLEDILTDDWIIVDIRDAAEIVRTPLILPALRILPDKLSAHLKQLDGARILLVCAHGKRSREAAHLLRTLGLSEVYSLAGGMESYQLSK